MPANIKTKRGTIIGFHAKHSAHGVVQLRPARNYNLKHAHLSTLESARKLVESGRVRRFDASPLFAGKKPSKIIPLREGHTPLVQVGRSYSTGSHSLKTYVVGGVVEKQDPSGKSKKVIYLFRE